MLKRIIITLVVLIGLVTVNVGCDLVSPEPSIEQIKSDLIGETISRGDMSWYFAALSEFKEVTIVDKIREGNTIEYDVTLELQDIFTDKMYTAEVLLIYQRSGTNWELFSVLTMSLKETGNSQST